MAHSLSLPLPNLHLYSSKPPSYSSSFLKPQINVVFFTPSLKIKHIHYNNCSLTRNNNNNGASSSSSSYSSSYPNHHFAVLEEDDPIDDDGIPITTHNSESTQLEEREKTRVPNPNTGEKEVKFLWGIFTNRWWAKLRGAFGQRFNLEGIICSSRVISRDRHMLLPHLTVPDIRYINWSQLRRRGFKGVVFDKDNTITLPYALTPWDPLKPSLDTCKAVFGEANVAVFSNSAGLAEFDPDGADAEAVEAAVGRAVPSIF